MIGVFDDDNRIASGRERMGLATLLTFLQAAVFFGFLLVGILSPATMATPVSEGSVVTTAFVLGLAVLIISVLLTGLYVLAENGSD
ncbi:DUF485 domain-containing protein [Scleromatobacter humisilvae]|uniref:DUF485 domain-containing protein n=1 Tax=Scleromatobacter humisilvae TaxID=2897159 RepID=A0A9X1YQR8_9BURK|nr:DUF485 domain-containing protein [Scleromatobacter humisilvae]MCK9689422.1 DUF485 domain-containing protein [Scleromatobacter humisilvae]